MPMVATPVFPQTIKNYVQTFVPADTAGTIKVIAVAGTNGTKIEALNITSTDGTAHDLNIYVTVSAVNYLLGTVSIPINAGNTNAIVSVDVLRHTQLPFLPYDPNGNRYIYLASGSTLSIGIVVAVVTAAKTVTIFAQGADF